MRVKVETTEDETGLYLMINGRFVLSFRPEFHEMAPLVKRLLLRALAENITEEEQCHVGMDGGAAGCSRCQPILAAQDALRNGGAELPAIDGSDDA